jgi:hypothetical protein
MFFEPRGRPSAATKKLVRRTVSRRRVTQLGLWVDAFRAVCFPVVPRHPSQSAGHCRPVKAYVQTQQAEAQLEEPMKTNALAAALLLLSAVSAQTEPLSTARLAPDDFKWMPHH